MVSPKGGLLDRSSLPQDPQTPRVLSWEDQLRELEWRRTIMLEQAAAAQKLAHSYRGFRVGAAVLAYSTKHLVIEQRWRLFCGTNMKVAPDSRPVCAEAVAINCARATGYDLVIGVTIVADTQCDQHSGVQMKTLHPCHECRQLLMAHVDSTFVRAETVIHTALPRPSTVEEFHTVAQLLALHREVALPPAHV